jgi:hypothetical protein
MDEQPASLDESTRKMRAECEALYWSSMARCVAYGIHPPIPPHWLNIPWEPQKGVDPVCAIYITGMILLALLIVGWAIWMWRICHG